MAEITQDDFQSFERIAGAAETEELASAARQLSASVSMVIEGLSMAGHPPDEEALKHPEGLAAKMPLEGQLEDQAANFVSAVQSDPNFSSPSFQCIDEFHKCRDQTPYHIAWCSLALAICLAERVIPLAGR